MNFAGFWRGGEGCGQLSDAVAKPNLSAVRAQLRDVASEAIAGALDALEARVQRGRVDSSRAGRRRQLERTREVLERDRALAGAALPQEAPRPSATPAAVFQAEPAAIACDEPIRTRSMAKLLAAQGHAQRALAIYAYLLAQDGGNAGLRAEFEALSEAHLRAPTTDQG